MSEATTDRAARKTRVGIVVSDSMDKTVVVSVSQTVRHPLYGKIYRRNSKLYAHDEANEARVGDKVRVTETRPLSKTKRWRVAELIERAK
jgi:small subunit ribosomal protein S17